MPLLPDPTARFHGVMVVTRVLFWGYVPQCSNLSQVLSQVMVSQLDLFIQTR